MAENGDIPVVPSGTPLREVSRKDMDAYIMHRFGKDVHRRWVRRIEDLYQATRRLKNCPYNAEDAKIIATHEVVPAEDLHLIDGFKHRTNAAAWRSRVSGGSPVSDGAVSEAFDHGTNRESAQWVALNLELADPDYSSAPSSAAVRLLKFCKSDRSIERDFWMNIWPRFLPKGEVKEESSPNLVEGELQEIIGDLEAVMDGRLEGSD
jgi:hypothetical protein